MNNKIGNYIHYHKWRYNILGTQRTGQNVGPAGYLQAYKIFNEQKKNVQNGIKSTSVSETKLSELSDELSELLYETNNPGNIKNETWEKVQRVIEEKFAEEYERFGISWRGGLSVYDKLKKIGTENSEKNIKISTLQKYKEALDNELRRVQMKQQSGSNHYTDSDINKISQTISEIESFLKGNTNPDTKVNIGSNINLINQINEAIAVESVPYQKAIGDVFEYFLAAASLYLENKSDKVTNELIDEIWKGRETSKVILSKENFSSDLVDWEQFASSAFNKKHPIDKNNSFELGQSADKLDVIFSWQNDKLNVSAKNYSLRDDSQKIHVVSGTSLLYLIQNEGPDFVNHWLNAVSTSNTGGKIDNSILQLAHVSMKMTILAKALTGDTLGRQGTADSFIVNSRKDRHVYVFSMKKLYENAIKVLREIEFKNYPDTIPNKWVGSGEMIPSQTSAQQRITNLLAQVHTHKISVSLPQSVLS